jgi:ABC-type transport system involved in multi-copper enzyme maturation permease subunit
MLSLIVKDLIVARWFLLAILVLYAAQLAAMTVAPPAAIVVTLIFTSVMAFGSLGIEESQGTEVTWCSLPVDRRQIVLARYSTTLLAITLGLGISWAASAGTLGLTVQSAAFFLLTVMASLFLPCYFRLGLGRGLAAFAIVSLGILVLLAGAGALISFLTDGSAFPDVSDEQWVAAAAAWLQRMAPFVAGTLVATALAVAAVSALLSARWYSARDC